MSKRMESKEKFNLPLKNFLIIFLLDELLRYDTSNTILVQLQYIMLSAFHEMQQL